MDALRREDARSRKSVALASAMQMRVTSMIDFTMTPPEGEKLLIDKLILPFVAFGPVLVAQLADIENSSKDDQSALNRGLLYARDKGLCLDLKDVYSDEEMYAARKSLMLDVDDPANRQFNQAFAETDFWHCAALTELAIRGAHAGEMTESEWAGAWREDISQICSKHGIGNYAAVPPPKQIRTLDTGALLSFHRQTTARKYAYHLEVDRRILIALGKKPTATDLEYDLPTFGQEVSRMKVIEIAVPNIAIPKLQNVKDMIDFVSRDEYRAPMRRLRKHIGKLIESDESTLEISEAIGDDMHALDNSIKEAQLKRHFGVCKFVFGSVLGTIEDIVKVRLESLAKRPFEIAEKITEQFYYGPPYEKEPLYMLWKLKDEFGGDR